jgi:hypothetical protein
MAKNGSKITFEDGSPAPFVQPGEPVIKLNDGIPPMGSPEFTEHLEQWHKKHNGVPFRLTEKGKETVKVS